MIPSWWPEPGSPRKEAGFGKQVMNEVQLNVMSSQTLAIKVESLNRRALKSLAFGWQFKPCSP